jgi:RNA polymerase sigma factor (sigma-70 family)
VIELDEALVKLAQFDPRRSRIAELRYFGGLSVEETAETLSISAATVVREWRLTRAWLQRELTGYDHA